MIYKIADNVISPLGNSSYDNYAAIKAGKSQLRYYDACQGMTEPFMASLFSEEQLRSLMLDGYTKFESLAIQSITKAIGETDIDLQHSKTILILSTTKANISHIEDYDYTNLYPGESAKRIAEKCNISSQPIVVCNACISGLAATVLASRLLEADEYDYAIVCGLDCQDKFIISGFQSFKALSKSECRPFDIERLGLNLGEAVATMILCNENKKPAGKKLWGIYRGAIRNDAYHISTPSPKGEGSFQAIQYLLQDYDTSKLALINAHGTATMYNDQMESKAISRAGLSQIPTNALKGYYGHTMGAAGIIETIMSMYMLDDNTIIGTKGFEEIGVSGKVNIFSHTAQTQKSDFIKMVSGFGGGNAAILAGKHTFEITDTNTKSELTITHNVHISPTTIEVDGKEIKSEGEGKELLTYIYKQYIGNYPKYYKMDMLARLGFIATEMLIAAENEERFIERKDRAIILFNHSSSICADKQYQNSICDSDNYFPSPSLFAYTLPNIVTGEIAIRNKYCGETSFYILNRRDDKLINQVVKSSLLDSTTKSMIAGWINCEDINNFEADIKLLEIKS